MDMAIAIQKITLLFVRLDAELPSKVDLEKDVLLYLHPISII